MATSSIPITSEYVTVSPKIEDGQLSEELFESSSFLFLHLKSMHICIYRTMCYKVEDVIVKVLAKKHDQAAAKGTPESVWFMKRA